MVDDLNGVAATAEFSLLLSNLIESHLPLVEGRDRDFPVFLRLQLNSLSRLKHTRLLKHRHSLVCYACLFSML